MFIKERMILMPFSAKSVLAYHALMQQQNNIVGFLDNAERLNGKSYCGVQILVPKQSVDPQEIIILCESKYRQENSIQLKKLGYVKIINIEDVVDFAVAKQAIDSVDIKTFSSLVPIQYNRMKEQTAQSASTRPICLLCKGDFAVSVAMLAMKTNVCGSECGNYNSVSGVDEGTEVLASLKDHNQPIIAFFSKYPFKQWLVADTLRQYWQSMKCFLQHA